MSIDVRAVPNLRRTVTHQRRRETHKDSPGTGGIGAKGTKSDDDGAVRSKTQSPRAVPGAPSQKRASTQKTKNTHASARSTRSTVVRPATVDGAENRRPATSSRPKSSISAVVQKVAAQASARSMSASRKTTKTVTSRKTKNDDASPKKDSKSKQSEKLKGSSGSQSEKLKGSSGSQSEKLKGSSGSQSEKLKGSSGSQSEKLKGSSGSQSEKLKGSSGAQSTDRSNSKAPRPSPRKDKATKIELAISDDAKPIVQSSNTFASRIYQIICSKQSARNVVIAPHALHTCISMLMFGSRGDAHVMISNALSLPANDAKTSSGLTELVQYYHKGEDTSDIIFHLVNGLFTEAKFGVTDEFRTTLKSVYRVVPGLVDFENSHEKTKSNINNCIRSLTNKRITSILGDYVSLRATMVLTSVLHLRAMWAVPFSRSRTKKEHFGTTGQRCSMMNLRHNFVHYHVDCLGADAVELPYAGNYIIMVLLLPRDTSGFSTMEGQMNGSSQRIDIVLAKAAAKDDGRLKPIKVSLPRFKIMSSHDMMSPLQSLGMGDILVGSTTLSQISDYSSGLRPDAVVQKVILEVDEIGSDPPKEQNKEVSDDKGENESDDVTHFNCNRPFVFMIKDARTGYVLFVGRVLNPSEFKQK